MTQRTIRERRAYCNFEKYAKRVPVRHHGKNESHQKLIHKTQKTRPELSKANSGKFVTEKRFVSAFSVVTGTFD